MTLATGKERWDGRFAEGDMEFMSDTGLWVPVSGTKATGKVPTIQSDGTIGWETPAGGGSGAEVLITETTLGSAAATIVFSSIVGTYRDLRVILRGRTDSGASTFSNPRLQFNGDTGSNYRWQRQNSHSLSTNEAEGSASAAFINLGWVPSPTGAANTTGSVDCRVFNYSGTTYYKNVLYAASSPASTVYITGSGAGWWASTSAITSVTLSLSAGNYAAGTIASLYGIM